MDNSDADLFRSHTLSDADLCIRLTPEARGTPPTKKQKKKAGRPNDAEAGQIACNIPVHIFPLRKCDYFNAQVCAIQSPSLKQPG